MKVIVTLVSCLASLYIAYFLGQLFFFDTLFYKKSAYFGYIPQNWSGNLNIFGKRSRDLELFLYNKPISISKRKKTLLLLGDSYFWGIGIPYSQTVSARLSRALAYSDYQVINLSQSGDNIFEHFAKYKLWKERYGEPDVVIFGLVLNDLFLNNPSRYSEAITNSYLSECPNLLKIYDYSYESLNTREIRALPYEERAVLSFTSETANGCAFEKMIGDLPKNNVYYLNLDSFRFSNWIALKESFSFLEKNNLPTIDTNSFFLKNYSNVKVGRSDDVADSLSVSVKEWHPSSFAHKIYAHSICEEILKKKYFVLCNLSRL